MTAAARRLAGPATLWPEPRVLPPAPEGPAGMSSHQRVTAARQSRRASTSKGVTRRAGGLVDLHGLVGNAAVAALVQRQKAISVSGGGLDGKPQFEVEGGDPEIKDWQRYLNSAEGDRLPELLVV